MTIKDYVYLVIIVAVTGGLGWWHHVTIVNEDNRRDLQEAQAVQKAKDATNAVILKDAQNAALTIENLQTELDTIRAAVPRTGPVIRLCGYASSPGPVPPARSVAGPAPDATTSTGGVSGVPAGDRGGDLGTAVRDLAQAGAIVSAYESATVAWAKGQQ